MKIKKQEELDWLHCQKTHYNLAQPAPESPDSWRISREMCVLSRHRRIVLIPCSCIEAFQPILLNNESLDLLFLGGHGVGEHVHGLHGLGHSYQSFLSIRRKHYQPAGSNAENLLLSLNSLEWIQINKQIQMLVSLVLKMVPRYKVLRSGLTRQ